MNWINFDDKKPKDGATVIIYNGFRVDTAMYDRFCDMFTHDGHSDVGGWVTHWMPLPEPPIAD